MPFLARRDHYKRFCDAIRRGDSLGATSLLMEATKTALAGDARAARSLGLIFQNGCDGKVVSPDPREAAKWFQKAAELGDRDAPMNLAQMYESGDGVPQDIPEARKWYELALERGVPEAAERLRRLPERTEPLHSPATEPLRSPGAAPTRPQAGWEGVEVIVVGSFSFQFNLMSSPMPINRKIPMAYFAAARNGVASDLVATGPKLFLNSEDTASKGGLARSEAHWQALSQFCDMLYTDGCEMLDSWGDHWYSVRFQRPIRSR